MQSVVVPHASTLLPGHGEERMEMEAGSGPWVLDGGQHLVDAFVAAW